MRPGRAEIRKGAARGEAVILFAVAGHTFAISAAAVDEIRNPDGLRPLAQGKVHSVLERGDRTCYVVDAAFHFRLLPAPARRVMVLRNSAVALAIESVDRMAQISALYALPRVFTGDERRWYRGLALIEGRVVPVVNPGAFLSQAELAALEAGLPVRPAAARTRGAVSA